MPDFPQDRHTMRFARYEHVKDVHCRSCNKLVELWKTTYGKFIYFDLPRNAADEYEKVVTHRSTCKPAAPAPKTESRRAEVQSRDRDGGRQSAVDELHDCFNPRFVIAIFDDSLHYTFRRGIPPEDARNEITAAANTIRKHLLEGK